MTFRILSLDGGGTWSLIQARALQSLYGDNTLGRAVLRDFSLVAANSGGCIVLGGLLANKRLSDITKLYQDKLMRKRIFHCLNPLAHPMDCVVHKVCRIFPQFSTERKLEALEDILGNVGRLPLAALGGEFEGCPHILISAFDYDTHRATFFRSDVESTVNTGYKNPEPTLSEAVHASSTAPVNFFDHPAHFQTATFRHRRFWDGAVGGYNNPVLAAVIEAVANRHRYGCSPQNIRVLSIGTATNALPLQENYNTKSRALVVRRKRSAPVRDIRLLATAILDDPPDAASFSAHVMLGGNVSNDDQFPVTDGPLVRLNPILQPVLRNGEWMLPTQNGKESIDVSAFAELVKLDMAATSDGAVELIEALYQAWRNDNILNQPIHTSVNLHPLIGNRYFSEGLSLWTRYQTALRHTAAIDSSTGRE